MCVCVCVCVYSICARACVCGMCVCICPVVGRMSEMPEGYTQICDSCMHPNVCIQLIKALAAKMSCSSHLLFPATYVYTQKSTKPTTS